MRRTARAVVGTVAAMAAAMSLTALPASGAPVGDVAKLEKCGFDRKGTPAVQAWYNHCGSGSVWIQVDHFVGDNTFQCVGPGLTLLGVWPDVYDAWYDNRTC
ncbi:DUF6355 family natural product biosynthesis protein [Allokutzneria oryzae]|uniref:DUF6355 family natural product biosynthesis protein n=1 Tax=Allokutzneria oryzae TaxID=1378989 RepID=A0ABV5ZTU8_9PSEU